MLFFFLFPLFSWWYHHVIACVVPIMSAAHEKGSARGVWWGTSCGLHWQVENKICLQHLYPQQIYGLQTVPHHSQNTGHPQIPLSHRPNKEPHFNNTHPYRTGHNRVWTWIIIIIIWEIKQRHWYAGWHHPVMQLWPPCVSAWWVAVPFISSWIFINFL